MSDKYPGGFVTAGAPAGFSVAFDGTGDYLSLSSTSLNLSTSDFTIETWIYATTTDRDSIIGSINDSNGVGSWMLMINNSGPLRFYAHYNGGATLNYNVGSGTLSTNTWNHVAVTRSGANLRIFLNGVQVGTTDTTLSTYTIDNAVTNYYIGQTTDSAAQFTGYLSNVRVVVGTALYTTTFTPPTQLFPITNTRLLTCQSPTIIDNSTNNFTITANGDAKVSNFTPFAGYQGFNPALGAAAGGVWTLDEAAYYQQNRLWPIYDPYFNYTTLMLHGNGTNGAQNNTFLDSSTNNFTITRNGNTTQGSFTPFSQTGWSAYNTGSSSYCQLNNADYAISTGDFTIEFWMFVTSDKANTGFASATSNGNLTVGMGSGAAGARQPYLEYGGGTYIGTFTNYLNTWTHVAFVRSSGTVTVYQNGVSVGTASKAGAVNSTANLYLLRNSGDGGQDFPGYVSNFRFSKSAVYTSNFTPSTAPLSVIANTVLLTFQNNRFVDNSALNATVTPTTTSVQAFSPFVPAYVTPSYSNIFDGTGDYLTVSGTSTACSFPAGTDFTIECWFFNRATTDQGTLWSNTSSIGASESLRIWFGSNINTLTVWSTYTVKITASSSFSNNVWNHVAVVRSGTTLTLYQNGINVGSASNNQSFTADDFTIGSLGGSGGPYPMNGVVSNLRVVKGTALYTANFTPPTAPLTAISGTQILTCQSNTFKDNSTNNFTITPTGDVKPITTSPFPVNADQTTLNSTYTPSLIGGSTYSAAAGDGLSFLTSSTQFGVSGDFTIEAWVYPLATGSNYNTIFQVCATTSSDTASYGLYYNSSFNLFWLNSGGGGNGFDAGSGINMVANQWNHVAISRSSGTIRCWTNGTLRISGWGTGSIDGTQRFLYVGCSRNLGDSVPGYLSSFRFVNGTAVYPTAANFSPPILPFTNITNTAALVNSTNGAIFDNTAKNVLQTVSTAQLSTAQAKYGNTSMLFNGSSDYVVTPSSALVSAWGGDCTIEGWYYTTSIANTPPLWMNSVSNSDGMSGGYVYSDGRVGMGKIGVSDLYSAVGLWSNNRWNHVAYVKAGATAYIFLNGVLVASGTATTYFETTTTKPMTLGRNYQSSAAYYTGYIQDFRVTKGYARYTTNFTPPTSQLQDQ